MSRWGQRANIQQEHTQTIVPELSCQNRALGCWMIFLQAHLYCWGQPGKFYLSLCLCVYGSAWLGPGTCPCPGCPGAFVAGGWPLWPPPNLRLFPNRKGIWILGSQTTISGTTLQGPGAKSLRTCAPVQSLTQLLRPNLLPEEPAPALMTSG